jgi:serine/threonine protein kinase
MSVAVDSTARALARVGQVLKDKWRLDSLLGVGGMAAVFAATHRNQKRVAVKILLPELSHDTEVRNRFVREGYAANTIGHPGAVSVLDDDVAEDGSAFLVMELLEGETVEARWEKKGQRLDLVEVLAIADQLLDVLAAAHAKGIVHRDIKPENLFLARGIGVKVLDFGIARVLEAARGKIETRAGFVMGTPAFMAPEQALAKWDEVDGRTDLWAVGATMFTLLSGQHVHEAGTGNEQLIRSATTPARSVGSCTKGLPRSVVALVDRALAFDRTHRWPDARAMQEAVRGALEAQRAKIAEGGRASSPSGDFPPSGTRSAPRTTLPSGQEPPPPPLPPPRTGTQLRAPAPPPPRNAPSPTRASSPQSSRAPAPVLAAPSLTDFAAPSADNVAALQAHIAARTAERDAAAAEVARMQPIVAEVNARLAAVRRRIAEAQERVTQARKHRSDEEERFRRQTSTRIEGVGEARKTFRRAMTAFARLASVDPAFATQFAASKDGITKARTFADARAKDVLLHEAALASFDEKAVKTGLIVAAAAVVLFLLLFFSPMIKRAIFPDDSAALPPPAATP